LAHRVRGFEVSVAASSAEKYASSHIINFRSFLAPFCCFVSLVPARGWRQRELLMTRVTGSRATCQHYARLTSRLFFAVQKHDGKWDAALTRRRRAPRGAYAVRKRYRGVHLTAPRWAPAKGEGKQGNRPSAHNKFLEKQKDKSKLENPPVLN
jgi:hypothetical protein